jgi:hypothetical protein
MEVNQIVGQILKDNPEYKTNPLALLICSKMLCEAAAMLIEKVFKDASIWAEEGK